MNQIKRIKSLHPDTLKDTDAKVIEEDGCVFLEKDAFCGKKYLIERDAIFYRKLNIPYKETKIEFDRVMIDITTRCNLTCPVCYRKLNSDSDLDFAALKDISNKFKREIILLCGGEPTVREDLPEIIRMFSRRHTVFLITNGIRLSDPEYLSILKRNGLRHVVFSLNALSEDNLSRINGRGLLEDKLKALENLKRLKIKVVLSVVLIKGLNEKEIKNIFAFCLKNRNFIYELRIRTMAFLGNYINCDKTFLSEMIAVVGKELNLSSEDLLKEFELKRMVNGIFGKEIFPIKSCAFDFYIKILDNMNVYPIAKNIKIRDLDSYPLFFRKIIILSKLISVYGVKMAFLGALKLIFKINSLPWIHHKNFFKVGLRSWPDINTIDLDENKRCRTGYWLNGHIISCCRANIIKDKLNT